MTGTAPAPGGSGAIAMSSDAYERLSFLDSSFILAESRTNHMHVGGVAILEAGSLRKPDGGIDIDRIRAYVEARLDRIPRYRQVVNFIPIEHHPVWVDDPHFNIHYHVRHTALPRPGDERQLKRLSGRIMSQQLDRAKPLWEIWVVEGITGGDRFALISKVHHAMVDGVSSVDLLTVLLTPEPTEAFTPAGRWTPRPMPTRWELLAAEARRRARMPFEIVEGVRERLEHAKAPNSDLRMMLNAAGDLLGKTARRVSSTPLNQPIGPHRRFDWSRIELSDVKAVRQALGGSVNDIVLATVSGAVRRFLEKRSVDVDATHFRVMTPVSMRTSSERGTLGNRVSAWMVDLPLGERDPRQCVARIRASTERLKESNQALGAEMLTKVVSWTPSTLLAIGSRMAMRAYPFNLVVTNVPGPQMPLYLLGARMNENYGLVPLTDYLGLGIVLFGYAGKLSFGFNADWDLVPDLHDFVLAIEESFADLRKAAGPLSVKEVRREA
jgi:diacylglycerol O-acyltransferase